MNEYIFIVILFTVNTCSSPAEVEYSSRSPDQATYDYATTVTFSCITGYENTAGDLVRLCQADTTWSGTEPICTSKVHNLFSIHELRIYLFKGDVIDLLTSLFGCFWRKRRVNIVAPASCSVVSGLVQKL